MVATETTKAKTHTVSPFTGEVCPPLAGALLSGIGATQDWFVGNVDRTWGWVGYGSNMWLFIFQLIKITYKKMVWSLSCRSHSANAQSHMWVVAPVLGTAETEPSIVAGGKVCWATMVWGQQMEQA